MLATTVLVAQPTFAQQSQSPKKIVFKSGGSVFGTVSESVKKKKKQVIITTATGSTLVVEKSKIVNLYRDNSRIDDSYKSKLASVPDSTDGHWEMYKWCKQEKSKFSEQQKFHLRRIVALDPSDKKAWSLLDHIQIDGRWVPEEQHYTSNGYSLSLIHI